MLPGSLQRFPGRKTRRLPFPATPKLRVVQIGKGRLFDDVQYVPATQWDQLVSLRPNVLAGPALDLQAIGEIGDGTVDHAIFALTGPGDQPVSDVLRVILWQKFGVPVYELLLDGSGCIFAAECEAHDGLHLDSETTAAIFAGGELVLSHRRRGKLHTGFSAVIESSECACGMPGLRISALEVQAPFTLQRLAVSA